MRDMGWISAGFAVLVAGHAFAQSPTSHSRIGRDAGDTAAGPVGQMSASTVGSMNAHAFVDNAAQSDMYEIAAAKIALARSHDHKVIQFARRMVQDHTKTSKALAANLPPSDHLPTGLDHRRQGLLDDLKNAAPGEFDKRYGAQQIAAHGEARTLMDGYAHHGDNPGLRKLAQKTAPTIAMHLQMAQALPH